MVPLEVTVVELLATQMVRAQADESEAVPHKLLKD
jgi:hypothetical protein